MARGFSNLSEEQLFERFRNGGKPKHLAEVFDRTAPELLRVALHLAPGPAPADDLGADLDAEILGTMSDDQKAKLVDMRASSRKLREEET